MTKRKSKVEKFIDGAEKLDEPILTDCGGSRLTKAVKKKEPTYTYTTVTKIRLALIDETNTLFAGSTDAALMCRKIDDVFARYV